MKILRRERHVIASLNRDAADTPTQGQRLSRLVEQGAARHTRQLDDRELRKGFDASASPRSQRPVVAIQNQICLILLQADVVRHLPPVR